MSSSNCVDTLLDTLELAQKDLEFSRKALKLLESDTKKLKRDLRFLRTFFLCVTKWRNHVSVEPSLSNIERVISREFRSLCLRFDTRKAFSDFRKTMCSFVGEINKLYMVLSDCFSQLSSSSPPTTYEVAKLLDALLGNFGDIFTWGHSLYERELIKAAADLEEIVKFMKSFITFALLRGVKQSKLEPLLIHFQFVAVNAARHAYVCWFDSKSGLWRVPEAETRLKIFELRQSIRPVDARVVKIFMRVLKASNLSASSGAVKMETDKEVIMEGFVNFLLGNLWELLKSDFSGLFFVQKLYEGLTFLNAFRKQLKKIDELDDKIGDLIGSAVNEAGIVVFQLSVNQITECFTKKMEVSVLEFSVKIELIKLEIAVNYPLISSALKSPVSDELNFMENLIESLNELPKCRVKAIAYRKDRIAMVQEDLVFLRSFLNTTGTLLNRNRNFKTLLSQIMIVAYKAKLIINSLMVKDIPRSPPSLFETIIEEIKMVKIKALEIDKDRHDFEARKVHTTTSNQAVSRGSIPTVNDVVVGFHDEANRLIDRLMRGSKHLDIIAIVGMPGLGKTTIAQRVYTDSSIICHFHIRAWCCVSKVYCTTDLLLDILVSIFPDLPEKYYQMTKDDLSEELYRRLRGNRYLVVMDDLWDSKAWEDLRRSFPDDANGSRILLTTRLHNLASEVKPNTEPHFLRQFTDGESWDLLQKKLFPKQAYPSAFSQLGMKIAQSCNGLPLAVVIVAGILANTKQYDWEAVAKTTCSSAICGTEQCMNILEMSYENLPDHLKPCLLYFGAFQEDQEIPVWRLTRLWIAEGLVQTNELTSPEDLAKGYVMNLIDRSLLMVAKRSCTGAVKTCRIHDLLHEFCVKKSKENNFWHSLRGQDELLNFSQPFNLRRLCIYSKPEYFEKSRLFCPRVNCLLFFAEATAEPINWSNVSFLFHTFKHLGVLDLGTLDVGDVFPSEMVLLFQLRYLAIAGRMRSIPSTFGKLLNLETFLVKGCRGPSECLHLPDTIWDMKNLRHLQASGNFQGFSLPNENLENSSDLNNLHTFVSSIFPCGKHMEKIMRKLPNIQRLKCEIKEGLWGCKQNVEMDSLNRLKSLKVCLPNENQYHIDLRFPSNLTKLTLCNFHWITIPRIGELPNLKVLKLVRSRGGGNVWDMKEEFAFPNLRTLKLCSLRIVRWTGSGDHFPCLQKLVLCSCYRLEEVPSCLGYMPTLDRIDLLDCSRRVESLMQDIKEDQISNGNENIKIVKYFWKPLMNLTSSGNTSINFMGD